MDDERVRRYWKPGTMAIPEGTYFVFGSNLAGIHGKGAALEARENYGAILGRGEGLQGRSYAIPTKDKRLKTLPLYIIEDFVNNFLYKTKYAFGADFYLTAIGCGLAGYSPKDIAPMFKYASMNVIFPEDFKDA